MEEEKGERHTEVTYMDDIVPRVLVLRVFMWTIIISFILCVIAYLLLVAHERAYRPGRKFPERNLPAPHMVANVRQSPFDPPTPGSTIDDDERVLLHSYGWVDPQKKLVRIPIDRAVELILAGQKPAPQTETPEVQPLAPQLQRLAPQPQPQPQPQRRAPEAQPPTMQPPPRAPAAAPPSPEVQP